MSTVKGTPDGGVFGGVETAAGEQVWFNEVNAQRDGTSGVHANPEIGVAFSGGGVRSATFNLGVLQALATKGILKRVGYLSSVSGGSYINAWLAAWIHKDRIERVSEALADHEETDAQTDRFVHQRPVAHLRRYSSYLTPQRGLLSSDTWTAIAAYVLRLMPNLLFVLLCALVLIVAPYIERDFYKAAAGRQIRVAANTVFDEQRNDIQRSLESIGKFPEPFNESPGLLISQDHNHAFQTAVSAAQYLRDTIEKDSHQKAANAKPRFTKKTFPRGALEQTAPDVKPLREALQKLDRFPATAEQYDESLLVALISLRNVMRAASWQTSLPVPEASDPALPATLNRFLERAAFYPGEDSTSMLALEDLQTFLVQAHKELAMTSLRATDIQTALKSAEEQYKEAQEEAAKNPVNTKHPELEKAKTRYEEDKNVQYLKYLDSLNVDEVKPGFDAIWNLDKHFAKDMPAITAWPAVPPETLKSLRRVAENVRAHADSFRRIKVQSDTHLRSYLPYGARLFFFLIAGILLLGWPGKDGDYDQKSSVNSRKAANKHARKMFLAILLMGPGITAAGLRNQLEFNPWLPLWFAGLSIICTLLYLQQVGALKSTWSTFADEKWRPVAGLLTTVTTGALSFWAVSFVLAKLFQVGDHVDDGYVLVAAVAPLLLLSVYVAMASSGMTFLPYQAAPQEWLNRIWGDTAVFTLLWLGVAALALVWPQAFGIITNSFDHLTGAPTVTGGYPLPGVMAVVGWILTTAAGVLSAYNGKTGAPMPADADPMPWRMRVKRDGNRHWLMSFLARVAPYVFVLGLLMLLASLVAKLFKAYPNLVNGPWHGLLEPDGPLHLQPEYWLLPTALLLLLGLGRVIDVNRLSLHNLYRFRLIECYVAASCGTQATELTLAELNASQPAGNERFDGNKYDGPFPIINCTMNVTKSGNLDLQKRRAINFFFSPTYSGFVRFMEDSEPPSISISPVIGPSFPTDQRAHEKNKNDLPYMSGLIETDICASKRSPNIKLRTVEKTNSNDNAGLKADTSITLGAAMAISGAAQSPNEGSHTSPAVAALLTAANVRLGWWLGNPRSPKTRRNEGPRDGLYPMVNELLAQATDASEYVYLSDGGHFENLGLFELVRRQCKLIILCDADCDPNYRFDDLINAMELCQIHFGATIDLPTDGLLSYGQSKFNRSAFAVGSITYINGHTGTILYLKPAVTRNNSVIVKSFDRDSAAFPHEPTTNQWFDESQFEAYRLLGKETALECFDHYVVTPAPSGNRSSSKPTFPTTSQAPAWWKDDSLSWDQHLSQVRSVIWP